MQAKGSERSEIPGRNEHKMHKCVGRHCPNKAYLGLKRDKIPFYCIDHVVPRTKHIKVYKKCNVIGCERNITYTDLNESYGACTNHALRNMKKSCYYMCFDAGCFKNATHGTKDYPLFACKDHAADSQLHDMKICAYPRCEAEPSYNYLGYKNKMFCKDHKESCMKDKERCIFHNCTGRKNLSLHKINDVANIICNMHAEIYSLALTKTNTNKQDTSGPKKTIQKKRKKQTDIGVQIEQIEQIIQTEQSKQTAEIEDCVIAAIQQYFGLEAGPNLDQQPTEFVEPEYFAKVNIIVYQDIDFSLDLHNCENIFEPLFDDFALDDFPNSIF